MTDQTGTGSAEEGQCALCGSLPGQGAPACPNCANLLQAMEAWQEPSDDHLAKEAYIHLLPGDEAMREDEDGPPEPPNGS